MTDIWRHNQETIRQLEEEYYSDDNYDEDDIYDDKDDNYPYDTSEEAYD